MIEYAFLPARILPAIAAQKRLVTHIMSLVVLLSTIDELQGQINSLPPL